MFLSVNGLCIILLNSQAPTLLSNWKIKKEKWFSSLSVLSECRIDSICVQICTSLGRSLSLLPLWPPSPHALHTVCMFMVGNSTSVVNHLHFPEIMQCYNEDQSPTRLTPPQTSQRFAGEECVCISTVWRWKNVMWSKKRQRTMTHRL